MRKHLRALRARPALGDEGLTLVELLVTTAAMLVVVGGFLYVNVQFSQSSTNTQQLTQSAGSVRNTVRVLEADLRSADPLLLVPTSFTADPNGSSNAGSFGTTSTDIVAMYEAVDLYASCPGQTTTTTSSTLPTAFEAQVFAANVIWAYDPGPGSQAHTLTRYSYCPTSAAWAVDMRLRLVSDQKATMFTVSQGSGTPQAQIPNPSSTSVPNQATPVCGSSVNVAVTVQTPKTQPTPFIVQVAVMLPNQPPVAPEAC